MRAGKSQWLFHQLTQYADLKRAVLYVGHLDDIRTDVAMVDHHLTTHSSGGIALSPLITQQRVSHLGSLTVSEYEVIGIDEAQFFPDLLSLVPEWLRQGKRLYVGGLDGDYEMKPIGSVLPLIPYATTVTKLTAFCTLCLPERYEPAPYTKRLIAVSEQIYIGGDNIYVSVCGFHHRSS